MKKLMTMIAAVAMSFGLFADGVTPYAISFETADGCTQGDALNKTEWTVPEGATATVIARTLDYNYQASGDARRTDLFEDTNDNSLKLETGKGTVICTPGNVVDGIFFDQVVKFTGYEEPPTVEDGKIAIWMSAIEADDKADPAVVGETNMFITCGTIDAAGTITSKPIDLGPADIDATHRVTIKSLGAVTEDGVAGFLVYIDGVQVKVDAAKLIVAEAQILSDFAAMNAEGSLFPALEEGAVAAVAYQGIGEIDDVAVDGLGPEFARFVDVTFAAMEQATVVKVVDSDGNEFTDFTKAISVKPGQLTVTLEAKPGWILKNATKTVDTKDAVSGEITIALTEADAVKAVAKIGTDYFETVEEALAAVEDGDTVEFLQECGSIDGNYAFTPGTTIAVAQGGNWTVNIASYVKDEMEFGLLTDHLGLAAEKQVVVNFANEGNVLALAGKIAGDGRVATRLQANGCVALDDALTVGDDEGAGAVLKAETVDTYSAVLGESVKITLGLNGAVITQSELTEADFGEIPTGYVLDIDTTTLEDWTIYSLVPEAEPVAKINDVTYNTLADAFAAAADGDTITVIANCTIDERINVAAAGRSITLDATDYTVTCNCLYPIVWGDYSESNAGTLTVVGGTFQQDTEPDGDWPAMILWTKNGKIKVTGGTYNVTKGEGQIAYVGGADAVNASIEVTGGTFMMCDKASGAKGDVFNVQNTLPVTKIQVTGGTFSNKLDDDALGPTFVAPGYKCVANASTGLWDVRALEKYAITIGETANATLTINGATAADFEATEDQEYTLAVTAAEGYNTPVITFEGETIDAGKYTFTKAGTLAASAEAIEYNINYTFTGVDEADKSKIVNPNAETTTYTVESETITFANATCEGYEFKGFAPASITKGSTGDKEIVGTFEKKSAGPVVNPEDDEKGEIKVDGTTAEVTLKGDATDIRIEGGESLTEVTVPVQLKQIRGVKADAIKVVAQGEDITAAFTKSGDGSTGYVQLELNPAASVTLKDGTEVAVTPTIGENVEASEVDITAGEIAVQAIPGLTYELIRSTKLGDKSTAREADSAKAESKKVSLTDKIEGEKPAAAFYQIKVEAK